MAAKLPRCLGWLIAAALLLSCLLAFPISAAEPPKAVTVAIGEDYPPFSAMDGQGRPWGWLVDIWRLWSKKTGIEVKFVAAPFGETLRLVGSGKVDVHGGCFYNEQRAEYLDYVAPLVKATTSFFFHKGIFGIRNVVDLAPFRIGVIKGDYAVTFLRDKLPEASLAEFETNEEMFTALRAGEIRVFVADTPVGLYFLKKWDLLSSYSFMADKPLYSADFQAAVKKGASQLARVVGQGLEQITQAERLAIERRWGGAAQRRQKGVLLVACERDNPPLSSLSVSGKPSGILVDIWRLWAAKTGRQIEFVFGTRSETIDWVRKGRADILSGLVRESYMTPWLDFSMPLFTINTGLFYRTQDGPVVPSELAGQNVGVLKDSFVIGLLAKRYPGITFEQIASLDMLARTLYQGEVRAVAAVAVSFNETLNRMGYSGDIVWDGRPLSVQSLLAGVTKDKPELLDLVNKGMAAISRQEILAIEKRWVPDETMQHVARTGVKFELSEAEKKWLAQHREIRLGVDTAWLPFEGLDHNEQYVGIASDYVKLVSAKLGVSMTPVPGASWKDILDKARLRQVDVLPCATPTPERGKYLSFTRPYVSFPYVVLTRDHMPFISGLKAFEGKKLAVIKGYAIQEFLKEDHPGLALVPVANLEEGLAAVQEGKADGFVDNQASINYMLNKTGAAGLKIALTTTYNSELAFGVRRDWPQLVGILEKALQSIPESEREKIVGRWINVRFQRATDWGFIMRTGGAAAAVLAIILAVIIIWNRRMAKEVAQRKQAEERFQTMAANAPGTIVQARFYKDGRREILYLSPHAVELYGAPPDVVIKEKRLLNYHPEDKDRVVKEIQQATKDEKRLNLVTRIVLPDGGVKWVRIDLSPSPGTGDSLIFSGFILDITARKQAEQEYLAAERKVKAMSQAVEDALVMIDAQGKVLFWNPAAEELFGYSEAEALGMDFHAMAAPDQYQEKIRAGLARFAQTGQGAVLGTTTEITARNRRGGHFPVEVTLSSFHLDGQWYAVGTVRDISERKKAEERLKFTQYTVDKAAQSIMWVEPDTGRLIYVNEATCESLGYTREELLGMSVPDIDEEFNREKTKALMRMLAQQGSLETEGVHRTKDGRFINVMLSLVLTQYQDRQVVAAYARDITELKRAQEALRQSEERSRLILDSAGEGIFGVDVQGLVTFVNPAAVHMLGFKENDLLGQGIHAVIHHHRADGSEYPGDECPMYHSYSRGEVSHIDDEVLWRKDGTSFPVEYVSMPISKEGKVMGAVVTFRDITERRQAEEELRRNLDELERFSRLVVGREERMIALKEEVNRLLGEMGRGERYKIVE